MLDFYNEVTGESFTTSETECEYLKTVFSEFRHRTGLEIDEYGTLRISCEHLALLADIARSDSSLQSQLNAISERFAKDATRLSLGGGIIWITGD